MKLQEKKYSCAAASIRAALYSLGHNVSESAVRTVSGTDKSGTDEIGILKAIRRYGHTAREYQFHSYKEAWEWLKQALHMGRPVLMCSDNWNHWVTAIGRYGAKVWIFDPDSTTKKRRNRYSGLELYSKNNWMRRWKKYNRSQKKYTYYAICITS